MATIFSFKDSPSRPFSPWEGKPNSSDVESPASSTPLARRALRANFHPEAPRPATEEVNGLKSLVSESDLGSTEYKLTLTGAHKSKDRFQHLKTQLLFRLQQTVPNHSAFIGSATQFASPEKIASSLQESTGTFYEIGVADDGTFVGLCDEEMDESLECLRKMASSLGCEVQVIKRLPVADEKTKEGEPTGRKLWVCEAFVKPCLGGIVTAADGTGSPFVITDEREVVPQQLRISFTGATTAGKSTLIGTLTTGERDNGRGKARQHLLRHRHELKTGVTSCVSQEIVGYKLDGVTGVQSEDQVVNYAADHTSGWTDIYSTAASAPDGGRVVLMTDSAGVPRYRRTALRSLIGFAPHYAFVVVPADCGGDTPEHRETMELSMAHLELTVKLGLRLVIVISKLDLTGTAGLKAVVATIISFLKAHNKRQELVVLEKTSGSDLNGWGDLEAGRADQVVDKMRHNDDVVPILFTSSVQGKGIRLLHSFLSRLPIPPTCGPQVKTRLNKRLQPIKTLFHIEETYELQPTVISAAPAASHEQVGIVVSGYLEKGTISIGDELWVGPFPPAALSSEHERDPPRRPLSSSITHTTYSLSPSVLPIPVAHHFLSEESGSGSDSAGPASFTRVRRTLLRSPLSGNNAREGEWACYRIVSARSCRVPVSHLNESEVGTFGLIPVKDNPSHATTPPAASMFDQDKVERFVRKGMVLLNQAPLLEGTWPRAYGGFTAVLDLPREHGVTQGVHTVIYSACVRAAAEVVGVTDVSETKTESPNDGGGLFDFDGDESEEEEDDVGAETVRTEVRFKFLARREWVQSGSGVFVMIGGGKVGKGRLALGGYWGEILGGVN